MQVDQLLSRYAAGKRDFRWSDLQGADLRNADLTDIDLVHANLTNAQLQRANLSHANLYKANLTGANLQGATLYKTNFHRAQLAGVIWEDADLKDAFFSPDAIRNRAETPPDHPAGEAEASTPTTNTDPTPEAESSTPKAPIPPAKEVTLPPFVHGATQSAPSVPVSVADRPPVTYPPTPGPRVLPPQLPQDWQQLPLPSLILLAGGYGGLGLLLGLHQTGLGAWLLVFSSAWICLWDDALVWFIPVYGAIALMIAVGISAWALLIAGVLMLALMVSLLVLGWSRPKAFKDSLWVGGIAATLINIAQWLFVGHGDSIVIIVSGRFPLAIILFLAMAGTGVGAIAWLQMQNEGFSRRAIATTFTGCAGLSLAVGQAIGYLLASP